ncbi:MAG: hypothetical protein KIS78_33590 [Labilithrix sp.]|nr:hypothetical protein [Labilithrix sp.]
MIVPLDGALVEREDVARTEGRCDAVAYTTRLREVIERDMRVSIVSALAASLAGFGCLLTTDLDGLGVAGTSDAGGPDGESRVDAGDGGAPGAFTCSERHRICTTFDDVEAPPIPGWQIVKRHTGEASLDATSSVSPPRSMSMSMSGEAAAGAYLVRDLSLGSSTSLTLAFDFRLVDCEPQLTNSLTFVYLGVGDGVGYGFVMLSSGSLAAGSVVDGENTFYPLEKLVQSDRWARIEMTFTAKTSSEIHLSLTVDGETSVDTDAPTRPPGSVLSLQLGVQAQAAPVGCRVAYDNVTLETE